MVKGGFFRNMEEVAQQLLARRRGEVIADNEHRNKSREDQQHRHALAPGQRRPLGQ